MRIAFDIVVALTVLMMLGVLVIQNENLSAINDGIKLERIQMAEVVKTAKEVLEQAALDIETYFIPEPIEYIEEPYFDEQDSTTWPTTTQNIELPAIEEERKCLDWIFDTCRVYEELQEM